MVLGMLFTTLVCLILLGISIFTLRYAFRKKDVNTVLSKTFGLIMFGFGLLYSTASLAALFTYLDKLTALENYYLGVIVCSPLVGTFIVFYFTYHFTRKVKLSYLVTLFYSIAFLFFAFHTTITRGVKLLEKTYFTYDFTLETNTRIFLIVIAGPLILVGIYDLIKSFIDYRKSKSFENKTYLFYSIAFITGYFPSCLVAFGFLIGWYLTFTSVVMTGSILFGLYAVVAKKELELTN